MMTDKLLNSRKTKHDFRIISNYPSYKIESEREYINPLDEIVEIRKFLGEIRNWPSQKS